MRRYCFLCLALLNTVIAFGQLNVESGFIYVAPNTTLFVDNHISIDEGQQLINAGTIDLTEDLINSGTLISQAESKVVFSGISIQYVKSNNAIFEQVHLKTSASFIILLDNFVLNNKLLFLDEHIWVSLGPHDFTITPTGQSLFHGPENYFLTNDLGKLIIQSNTGKLHPVGFDQFNYLPALAYNPTGEDAVAVRVYQHVYANGTESGDLINSDVVSATWDIQKSTPEPSELIIKLHWNEYNESAGFDRSKSVIGWYDGISYNGSNLTSAIDDNGLFHQTKWNVGSQSGKYIVGGLPAMNYVLCAPKVFLHGPYNGTDMNDHLRTESMIPLVEPHTALGFNQFGIGGGESVDNESLFDQPGTANDIVDWVFLELRQYLDNDEIYLTTSALLQRDGDIVNTKMEPIKFYGAHPGEYYLTVRHRNHLGVHTANKLNFDKTISNIDFTNGSTPTLGINAQIDLGAGISGLWGGDANRDGQVNAVDKNYFWSMQNGTTYDYFDSSGDFNLDAVINAVDKNAKWRLSNSQIANYDY